MRRALANQVPKAVDYLDRIFDDDATCVWIAPLQSSSSNSSPRRSVALPSAHAAAGSLATRIGKRLPKCSSLQVSPANEMPRIAVERGATLILTNRGAPPLGRASRPRIYDGVSLGTISIGEVLPAIVDAVLSLRTVLRLLVLVAIAACGKRCDAPTCSTMPACNDRDGQRVQIVGVYTIYDPMSTRTKDMPPTSRQVEVRLAQDIDGPLLGAVDHDDRFRPLDEIARLAGKRVRVTGVFRLMLPPEPDTDTRGGPFISPHIHPIERIEVE
jgi:hypothetical protein